MTPLISINRNIILASASPRRKELLARMGLSFIVSPSGAEDSTKELSALPVSDQVCFTAEKKAEDAASRFPSESLVIGADTIVVLDNKVLGKPRNRAEAISMLNSLQGRWHRVLTGVALLDPERGWRDISYASTLVEMMELSMSQIEKYADSGEYMDKAGGYGIQGLAAAFIPRLEGCYFNVVGLPVHLLYKMLLKYKAFADSLHTGY
ncbi:MAG: Maf family protein [Caldicoprobacterales bacterium]|jgi:septum formation protein